VVTAQVVGTEPILAVRLLESQRGVSDQGLVIVLADCQRNEGKDRQRQEQNEEKDRSLVLQKALEYRAPVGIVGVTDALGLFGRIFNDVKQLVVFFARKIRCFGH